MKVTTQMAGKWVKAAFLAILGIIILIYANGFVEDLKAAASDEFNISFDITWDLLTLLLYILVAWLLVDAALTVALSIKGEYYTLYDVMERLKVIEKRLGSSKPRAQVEQSIAELSEESRAPAAENDVPPPPRE